MENQQKNILSKVVFLGPYGVGKSCLVKSITGRQFNEAYDPTFGVDFYTSQYEEVKFQIWDTAGQDKYRPISYPNYRGASICIFVIDLSNNNLIEQEIEVANDHFANIGELTNVILVGNKCDLKGMETEENQTRIKNLRQIFGDKCDLELEVSAKDKTGLDRMLEVMVVEAGQYVSRANEGKQ